MIEPGAIFEVPAALADPPQRALQANPPHRDNRWVLVLSCKADCRDAYQTTVTGVLLSAQVEYQGRHDVVIRRPDGGVRFDSIAQADMLFTLLKVELIEDRFRGTVLRDTLIQIRAKVADALGFAGPGAG